ncbi:MAG: penicillin-binding protein 2 [Sandaracinus sp.]|nr:penicillin-binding protein 2 [Sandaracinus sp.]
MLLSPRREVGEFRKRYKWMALATTLTFGLLLGRMAQLQLVEHDEWARIAQENITKTISLPATRGLLRDTRGRTIAENRPSYVVYLTPQLLEPEDVDRVAELMNLDEAEAANLRRRLDGIPPHRRTHQIEMFSDIDREQLAALETHSTDLPGVDVVPKPARTYPWGHLGAHAVGYLNEVSAEDLERLGPDAGYRAGDVIGRMGVEKGWESYLRGHRGYRRVLVDARGRRQREARGFAIAHEEVEPPTPGHDLVLSLDMELMRSIERAFAGHPSGAAVVVDVNSGRVRALYSKPSYDVNELVAGMAHADYAALRDDPFRPLIDKTIYESYFPGSTFKPFSALAALDQPGFDPANRVECIGYYQIGTDRKRCTSAHGEVDMRQALVQSCNTYFYVLAERVGLEPINDWARRFGFAERTGVGINSEARGFLATRDWYTEHFGRFRVGDTMNTAIGQGNTRTTLLQLALAYGALANGGTLYRPQIIESIREADGTLVEELPPQVARRIAIPEAHARIIASGLFGVVNEQAGTAYDAHVVGGIVASGKTGTAEIQRGGSRPDLDPRRAWYFQRSHAWFAGYAPSHDPEVAIVVLVEHGGAGGRAAAPTALRVLQDYLGERPGASTPGASTPGASTPGGSTPAPAPTPREGAR